MLESPALPESLLNADPLVYSRLTKPGCWDGGWIPGISVLTSSPEDSDADT